MPQNVSIKANSNLDIRPLYIATTHFSLVPGDHVNTDRCHFSLNPEDHVNLTLVLMQGIMLAHSSHFSLNSEDHFSPDQAYHVSIDTSHFSPDPAYHVSIHTSHFSLDLGNHLNHKAIAMHLLSS